LGPAGAEDQKQSGRAAEREREMDDLVVQMLK
jgi:hypothetical protein